MEKITVEKWKDENNNTWDVSLYTKEEAIKMS